MNKIVGIQFKSNNKVYDFDSGHFVLKKGDKVMVITAEGPLLAVSVPSPKTGRSIPLSGLLKKYFAWQPKRRSKNTRGFLSRRTMSFLSV